MQLKQLISFLLISFLTINTHAQEQKPFWLGVHGSRSFASSGDNVGLMGSIFLEKSIKKNKVIGLEVSFNSHGEIPEKIFESPSSNPSDAYDMSYWRVMSGVQIGAYGGKQFKIAEKHFFRIDVGPILRVQINSNDGYGVYYPIGTNLPFPVIAFDNRFGVKRTTFSVGLKAAFQYQYQVSDKWRIGVNGSIQSDSQGDNFYNYGLTVATRFLR